MSIDEFILSLILALLFGIYFFLLRINRRRTICVFILSSLLGFIAQLMLGRTLNLYTPNITLYVFYVSIAVIISWGAGLTSIWALHTWASRIFRIPPGLGTYTLCGIPILIALEWTGSNIIKMKLHDYRQYAAVMPYLNAMHAPKWLYAYYIILAVLFFYLLKFCGLYSEDGIPCRFSNSRAITVQREEGAD